MKPPSFVRYIEFRLGSTPGAQFVNFLWRPFASATLANFWRDWNPVWSYYLTYFVYRPLRRFFPHWLSILFTFMISGCIHGLLAGILTRNSLPIFGATLWFAFLGCLVIGTERWQFSFACIPKGLRWIVHITTIVGTNWLTSLLLQWIMVAKFPHLPTG